MKQLAQQHWPLLLALILYSATAYGLNFTQDDAYISYRVVQNFLNSHGLVFNVGEQVEGHTNFGWVIYMIFTGAIGLGYIAISKLTGFLCGAGIIVITHRLSRELLLERQPALVWLPTLLVGTNMSLAYWAPAGLETAAFGLMAMLSLYWYVKRSWFLIWSLFMAVWFRPEGALLTGIIIIVDAIQSRGLPRFSLSSATIAFVLSLPMVGFKIAYYGGILPNPFYAKTGMDIAQITNGLEYTWRFLYHYGAFGIGLLLTLFFWKKLTDRERTVWLFAVSYTVYIILVGGDVLSVHRFFVPLMAPYAVLIALGFWLVIASIRIPIRARLTVFLVLGIAVVASSLTLPRDFVENFNRREKLFTAKMQRMAQHMKQSDDRMFSVALPTIGIFSYELPGHRIIDMLGLTDSTIARHSDETITGMETTWKESKHNSTYLLGEAPDYILFSTGIKPSAPAERALMLYPQFLNSYRTIGWYFAVVEGQPGALQTVFKRIYPVDGPFQPTYPIEWVNEYKLGLDQFTIGRHNDALVHYRNAAEASPQPYYPYLLYQIGFSNMMLGDIATAERFFNATLDADSVIWQAHKELLIFAYLRNNTEMADLHRRWIGKMVPWYLPRADSLARQAVERTRQRQRR